MSVVFDGKLLIEPAGAFQFRVGVAGGAAPLSTGRVALIGEADGGSYAHGVGGDTTVPWYSDVQTLRNEFRSGVGVKCAELIFHPSPQVGGASAMAFLRAQAATAAAAIVLGTDGSDDQTAVNLTSLIKGTDANKLRVKSEPSTEELRNLLLSSTAKAYTYTLGAPAGSYASNRYAITCSSWVSTDDFYNGCEVTFTYSATPSLGGFKAVVVDYDGTNKTAILDRQLPVMSVSGDKVRMEKSITIVTTAAGSSTTLVTTTDYVTEYIGAIGFWGISTTFTNIIPRAYVISAQTGRRYSIAGISVSGTTVTLTVGIGATDTAESALNASDQGVGNTFTLCTGLSGQVTGTGAGTGLTLVTQLNGTADISAYFYPDTTQAEAADYLVRVRSDGTHQVRSLSSIAYGTNNTTFTVHEAFVDADGVAETVDETNSLGWYIIRAKKVTVHRDTDSDSILDPSESYEVFDEVQFPCELVRKVTDTSVLVAATLESGAGAYPLLSYTTEDGSTYALENYVFFAGGTSPAMTSADIAQALSLITTEDVQFVFVASEMLVHHALVSAHCLNDAETPRRAVVGGALGETSAQAIARSVALNSELVANAWPGVYIASDDTGEIALHSPMYFAALVTGLAAGLPPQSPLTRKTVQCFGFELPAAGPVTHNQRQDLISGGVLFGRYIKKQGYVINKGVNTIQNNTTLWNYIDRTSPEWSLVGCKLQQARECAEGAELFALGGTLETITVALVTSWAETTLNGFKARAIIKDWNSLTVNNVGDAYYVNYKFNGNNPINFVLTTGTVIS